MEAAGIEPETPRFLKCGGACGCENHDCPSAANAQQSDVIVGTPLASLDHRLRQVVQLWAELSDEIRDPISRLANLS